MALDPITRRTIFSSLQSIWDASGGKQTRLGSMLRKALWPTFGAVAAAPVVGYEINKRMEPPEDKIMAKASEAISQALDAVDGTRDNLDVLRVQTQMAKARARRPQGAGKPALSFTAEMDPGEASQAGQS